MCDMPLVIGYNIDAALARLGNDKKIITEMTQTPFPDKIEERKENKPIVVRQLVEDEIIKLTVCRFK